MGKRADVIITDGDNTAETISVAQAVGLAIRSHVTIFTIGIGTAGKVQFGQDERGNPIYVENTFSDSTMKEISQKTGGSYSYARTKQEVAAVLARVFR